MTKEEQDKIDAEKKTQEEAEAAKGGNDRTEARFKKILDDKSEAEKKAAEAEARAKAAEFERDFERAAAKNPAARELRSEIEEKVKSGMSLDDATTVVLHSKGKLGQPENPGRQHRESGSAAIPPGPMGDKKPSEMTRDELRSQLLEEEKKGNLFVT